MQTEETKLMLAIKNGDPSAFEKLYHLYKKPLLNFFYRMCWDTTLSEDLLQEVFLNLWRHAHRYVPTAKVSTYLFRIAHNLWINELSKLKRPAASFENPEPSLPLHHLLQKELSQEVKKAIHTLPEGERMVLILCEYNGFKYAEVAEILDIPLGTVKSRLFSAIQKLRLLLDKYAQE